MDMGIHEYQAHYISHSEINFDGKFEKMKNELKLSIKNFMGKCA